MAARIDGKQSFVHPHVYTQKQKQHQHSNYNSTKEQQWSYCSEWNSSTSLWVLVVTWPPSPWRLNEDRFKRERLLIYRGLNTNGWLETHQGRGWFMQTLVPGVTPPLVAPASGNEALKQQELWKRLTLSLGEWERGRSGDTFSHYSKPLCTQQRGGWM